jgi:AraC-like DNA-binding protein
VVTHHAAARITSLFLELLERQFPITTPRQRIALRTTQEYADRLAVHGNHLNKALKEVTGKTTREHIGSRLIQEAKFLLRSTDWSIAQIAYSLGFEYPSHFSGFYKKHTRHAPSEFRR